MRRVPEGIIELVRNKRMILSQKARYQLDGGRLETEDLLNSIIYGRVLKKERDEKKRSQYKYTIVGPSKSGEGVYSCGKVVKVIDRKYFIITFHEEG